MTRLDAKQAADKGLRVERSGDVDLSAHLDRLERKLGMLQRVVVSTAVTLALAGGGMLVSHDRTIGVHGERLEHHRERLDKMPPAHLESAVRENKIAASAMQASIAAMQAQMARNETLLQGILDRLREK